VVDETDHQVRGRDRVRHSSNHRTDPLASQEPRCLVRDPEIPAGIQSAAGPILGWHVVAKRRQGSDLETLTASGTAPTVRGMIPSWRKSPVLWKVGPVRRMTPLERTIPWGKTWREEYEEDVLHGKNLEAIFKGTAEEVGTLARNGTWQTSAETEVSGLLRHLRKALTKELERHLLRACERAASDLCEELALREEAVGCFQAAAKTRQKGPLPISAWRRKDVAREAVQLAEPLVAEMQSRFVHVLLANGRSPKRARERLTAELLAYIEETRPRPWQVRLVHRLDARYIDGDPKARGTQSQAIRAPGR
jgi:hypothetical protein